MKTIKQFRAWKNGRLIPCAIPLDGTHIVTKAKLVNGIAALEIDVVDCVEQHLLNKFYEGDVVLILDRFDFSFWISLASVEFTHLEGGQYAECFKPILRVDLENDKITEEILETPLLLGTIHEKSFVDEDYWKNICKSKLNEKRKKYDK